MKPHHQPERETTMDIGINKKDREQIADGLSHLLADSFTLYLKTHNFTGT